MFTKTGTPVGVHSSHGQSCSRAHCNTGDSSCPPKAAHTITANSAVELNTERPAMPGWRQTDAACVH